MPSPIVLSTYLYEFFSISEEGQKSPPNRAEKSKINCNVIDKTIRTLSLSDDYDSTFFYFKLTLQTSISNTRSILNLRANYYDILNAKMLVLKVTNFTLEILNITL